MKRILPYILVLYVTTMLILFPESSISYAKNAINICGDIIIPSLFPFFICSGLLIYSGFAKALSKFANPIMKPVFNIGGCGASALVLGVISGYPLGAVTACQLYESGYLSKTETERLLAFCNNSGPLFILGAVGAAIYSSIRIGVILYTSHILATLLVGFLFRFYKTGKHSAPAYTINQAEDGFSQIFAKVLANSINSILTVCGAVIFFGVVSGVITHHLPANDIIKSLITGILELTGGTKAISDTHLPLTAKLVLSAFVVGFSGLCVHLQVASIVAKHELSLIPYIFGKFLHGIIAAGLTLLYLFLFPENVMVSTHASPVYSASFCMSSIYSIMGVLFITFVSLVVLLITYLKFFRFATNKKRDI